MRKVRQATQDPQDLKEALLGLQVRKVKQDLQDPLVILVPLE